MPAVNRTPPLPEVNSQVTVRLADDETEFPTRVEDVGPDQLALATPSVGLGFVDVLEQDNRLFVTWTVANGRREFPARLLRSETSPVPMWYVAPTGPTVAIQRRRFARVQTSGAFEIVLADEPLPATLLDLSEGGLRCTVRKPVQIERYVPVVARLSFLPQPAEAPGQVIRVIEQPEVLDVGITFDDPAALGDEIRKFVFAVQLQQRAAARRA